MTTPAWQNSGEWKRMIKQDAAGPFNARQMIHAADVAVAADRAHLATQIEALRVDADRRHGWGAVSNFDAVLAVLRDAP